MNVYLIVKKLCEERGEKIGDVEAALGLGKKTIYSWNNSSPSVDKVKRIADYFGVSINYMLGIEDDHTENTQAEPAELTDEEQRLLGLYNSLSVKNRFLLDELLSSLVKSQQV